jgi:polyhydroxyalkanoate synthesis regulator phasin
MATATQTTENTKNQTCDIFQQASETFKTAVENGVRFQQDAIRSMTDCVGRGETPEDMKHRIETITTDSLNLVRRNVEQSQKLFDEGCKTGLEMIKKNFSMFENGNGHNKDFAAQTRDMWTNAFEAVRNTVDAAARTSVQSMENWSSFVTKTMAATEKKAAR